MLAKLISLTVVLLGLYAQSTLAIQGDATFYNLGLTACGTVHSDEELVAAVGVPHWRRALPILDESDPTCSKRVSVRDPESGNSVVVSIRDKCMSCVSNNIDLSPAAFKILKPLDVGKFLVDWNFM